MKKRTLCFGMLCMSFFVAGCSYPLQEKYPQFLKDLLRIEEEGYIQDETSQDEVWTEITVQEFYNLALKAEKNPYNVVYASGKLEDPNDNSFEIIDAKLTYEEIDEAWIGMNNDNGKTTKLELEGLDATLKLHEIRYYIEKGPEEVGIVASISKSNKDNYVVEWRPVQPNPEEPEGFLVHSLNKYFCITAMGGRDYEIGVVKFDWKKEDLQLNYEIISLSQLESLYANAPACPYNVLDVDELDNYGSKGWYKDLEFDASKNEWVKGDFHIDLYHLDNQLLTNLKSNSYGTTECRKYNDGTYAVIAFKNDTKRVFIFDSYFYISKNITFSTVDSVRSRVGYELHFSIMEAD